MPLPVIAGVSPYCAAFASIIRWTAIFVSAFALIRPRSSTAAAMAEYSAILGPPEHAQRDGEAAQTPAGKDRQLARDGSQPRAVEHHAAKGVDQRRQRQR